MLEDRLVHHAAIVMAVAVVCCHLAASFVSQVPTTCTNFFPRGKRLQHGHYASLVQHRPTSRYQRHRHTKVKTTLMKEQSQGELEEKLEEGRGGMSRAQAFSAASSAVASAMGFGATLTGSTRPAEAGIFEFLFPPQDVEAPAIDVGGVDREITFDDFERSLLKGEVRQCEFFGFNFQKAVIQLADGSKALIGEGYPEERAFTDDSPMKVVGMLRNAGVPYTTQFKTSSYNKPRSYKSVETLEAESRQRNEDAVMDRLMSEDK